METMIGIAALLVGLGVAWLCFAVGVYFFTRRSRRPANPAHGGRAPAAHAVEPRWR